MTRHRPPVAEFLGTFALVFAGTGAIVVNDITGGAVTHPGVAIVFGAIVFACIAAFGDASGAHLNPAVTLGLWLAKRFAGREVLPYVLSQLAGAVAASVTIRLLFPDHLSLGGTAPAGSAGQSFALEVLLSLFLTFVILATTSGPNAGKFFVAAAVGLTVGLEALFAGPICGASMNPARSFGPALVAWQMGSLWIYLIAPTVGAAVAVPVCRSVYAAPCCRGGVS
jgi:aquaporin NIP